MKQKLIDTLTFCKRIGALKLGSDPVKGCLACASAKLVLLADDLSEKSAAPILRLCQESGTPVRTLPFTMDEIWYLVGKRSGILAVTEKSFAQKLTQLSDSITNE